MSLDDYQPPGEADAPPIDGAVVRPMRRANNPARVPPHDLVAEEALIGTMLNEPRAVDAAIAGGLSNVSFYKTAHQYIYEAILDLVERGDPVDPITVADQLRNKQLLDAAGGPTQLIGLQASMPFMGAAHAAKHARIISQLALLRRLIGVAGEIAELGYSHADDPHEVVEKVRDLVEHAATSVAPEGDPWTPISIGDAWDRPILEQPEILRRDDGSAFLYKGRINTVVGPPESGKSWVGYIACAQLADMGTHCAYIDLEDRVEGAAARLSNLGLDRYKADQYIHYFSPDTDLTGAVTAMQRLGVDLALIIVDSASEAIVAGGGEINSNDDGTKFGRALRRLAHTTGAAILFIDHVKQDHEAGSGKSLGAGAKRRFLDGAAYETIVHHRFGPGHNGQANIINTKDRHGGVVANCLRKGKQDLAGQLMIESNAEGKIVAYGIANPEDLPSSTTDAGEFRPTGYMERISRALELRADGVGTKELRALIQGRNNIIDAAVRALVEEGFVEVKPGARGARIHTVTTPFREHEEKAS